MLMNVLVYLLLIALGSAFRGVPVSRGTAAAGFMSNAMRLSMAAAPAPPAPADDPYLVHVCVSCEYEYDEAKGFKKRMPPGTRLRDVKTFACPVCGAAIDQFKVKE